ncbi:hypothetical protein OAM47_01400 [Gammaproteobacteria bacterium]|nr:hypothetical protein [Gammaproteobacteria bacterium]MDC0442796.1 hypothetical protein [Gammaproteobacteria bacterium]|tara:strand:+ start:455 stop:709 length:255 start_codon:yes stop_codon:yes gene_type:complete
MKLILIIPILLTNLLLAGDEIESTKVADLSVEELKKIVRSIVQDSIEKCEVNGTMKGRAKVNLKVEGEVEAKMTCDFSEYESKD